MANKNTVLDAVERVASTAIQAAIGVAAGLATVVAVGAVDWRSALVTVGVAAGVSVLKNIQSFIANASGLSVDEKALAQQVEDAVQKRLIALSPVKSVQLDSDSAK